MTTELAVVEMCRTSTLMTSLFVSRCFFVDMDAGRNVHTVSECLSEPLRTNARFLCRGRRWAMTSTDKVAGLP